MHGRACLGGGEGCPVQQPRVMPCVAHMPSLRVCPLVRTASGTRCQTRRWGSWRRRSTAQQQEQGQGQQEGRKRRQSRLAQAADRPSRPHQHPSTAEALRGRRVGSIAGSSSSKGGVQEAREGVRTGGGPVTPSSRRESSSSEGRRAQVHGSESGHRPSTCHVRSGWWQRVRSAGRQRTRHVRRSVCLERRKLGSQAP